MLMEGEIERFSAAGHDIMYGQQTLVNRIADNVINSEQYVCLILNQFEY